MDEARLIKLYSEQPRAVDDLPYTSELERLVDEYNKHGTFLAIGGDLGRSNLNLRIAYKYLQRLRKAGKLVRKRRANSG